jgi:hypothetical protein
MVKVKRCLMLFDTILGCTSCSGSQSQSQAGTLLLGRWQLNGGDISKTEGFQDIIESGTRGKWEFRRYYVDVNTELTGWPEDYLLIPLRYRGPRESGGWNVILSFRSVTTPVSVL